MAATLVISAEVEQCLGGHFEPVVSSPGDHQCGSAGLGSVVDLLPLSSAPLK